MVPHNYRTHDFHLFGKDLSIAGMAGLHNNANNKEPLIYLRDTAKRVVLIGLHETHNFTPDATRYGVEYHYIPVPDLVRRPIDPAKYDAIYAALKKATEEGKQVAIHCGAGDGRTGTALATLKLRELIEAAAKANPAILDEKPGATTSVYTTLNHKAVTCTPFVKAAVEGIRMQSNPMVIGSQSVETENDISTLIAYEKHLRIVIKQELGANLTTSTTSPQISNKAFWSGLWRSIVNFFVGLVKSLLHWCSGTPQSQHGATPEDTATSSTDKGSASAMSAMMAGGDSKTAVTKLEKVNDPHESPIATAIIPYVTPVASSDKDAHVTVINNTKMY